MSWNSPKGDDSSTSSKSSCTPLSSNNSFSCPRPQSPAWSVSSKGGNTFTQYSTPRRSDRSLSSRPQSPTWSVSSKGSVNSTGYITPMRVKTPPLSQDRSHQAYLPHPESCDRSVSSNYRDGFIRSSSPGGGISRLRSQARSQSPGRNVSREGDARSTKSRNQISGISSTVSPYRSPKDYASLPLNPTWGVASICDEKSSHSRFPSSVKSLPSSQGRAHQSNHTYPEKPDRIVSSKDSNKPNQSNRPKWGMPRLVKTNRSLQHHQHTSTTVPRSRTEPKRGGTYI